MEPLPEDEPEKFVFAREIVGNAIPPSFIPACEKGFREACNYGGLTGHPVQVRILRRRESGCLEASLSDSEVLYASATWHSLHATLLPSDAIAL